MTSHHNVHQPQAGENHLENRAAPGISYFTPTQDPPAGTAFVVDGKKDAIPKLFRPIKLRGLTLQNREFAVSGLAIPRPPDRDGFRLCWTTLTKTLKRQASRSRRCVSTVHQTGTTPCGEFCHMSHDNHASGFACEVHVNDWFQALGSHWWHRLARAWIDLCRSYGSDTTRPHYA